MEILKFKPLYSRVTFR